MKHECPYCGEKSFSPVKKAFAGSLTSKGTPCPNCGRKCVNGKQSTIFHTIAGLLMLAGVLFICFRVYNGTQGLWMAGLIALYLVVCKVADAFFFPLEKNVRIDS